MNRFVYENANPTNVAKSFSGKKKRSLFLKRDLDGWSKKTERKINHGYLESRRGRVRLQEESVMIKKTCPRSLNSEHTRDKWKQVKNYELTNFMKRYWQKVMKQSRIICGKLSHFESINKDSKSAIYVALRQTCASWNINRLRFANPRSTPRFITKILSRNSSTHDSRFRKWDSRAHQANATSQRSQQDQKPLWISIAEQMDVQQSTIIRSWSFNFQRRRRNSKIWRLDRRFQIIVCHYFAIDSQNFDEFFVAKRKWKSALSSDSETIETNLLIHQCKPHVIFGWPRRVRLQHLERLRNVWSQLILGGRNNKNDHDNEPNGHSTWSKNTIWTSSHRTVQTHSGIAL